MKTKMEKIFAEISAGELVDKITILEIKKAKISNEKKLEDIKKELESLNQTFKEFIPNDSVIKNHMDQLKNINSKLWDIEDGKRELEKKQDFSEKFVELARSVYKFNDQRAKIKSEINKTLGSNIKEVKSYE
jgi:vacuolar-type H+-ATPase subunit I/STV1